jgi:hypothetical protein
MKTHQQKLEDIRKACVAVNGDITKLQFGCKVIIKDLDENSEYGSVSLHQDIIIADNLAEEDGFWELQCKSNTYECYTSGFEIIGRPITLADVLLAIAETEYCSFLQIGLTTADKVLLTAKGGIFAYWNLLKTLDGQSEETVAFIHSLLHKE